MPGIEAQKLVVVDLPLVGMLRRVRGLEAAGFNLREVVERMNTPQELVAVLETRYHAFDLEKQSEPPFLVFDGSKPIWFEPEWVLPQDCRGDFGVNLTEEYQRLRTGLIRSAHVAAGSRVMAEHWRAEGGGYGPVVGAAFKVKEQTARRNVNACFRQMRNIEMRAAGQDMGMPWQVYRELQFEAESALARGVQPDPKLMNGIYEDGLIRWQAEQPASLLAVDGPEHNLNGIKWPQFTGFGSLALPMLTTLEAVNERFVMPALAGIGAVWENPLVKVIAIGGGGLAVLAACNAADPTNFAPETVEATRAASEAAATNTLEATSVTSAVQTEVDGVVVSKDGGSPTFIQATETVEQSNVQVPVWTLPSFESSQVEPAGGPVNEQVRGLADTALSEAKTLGIPFDRTSVIEHGTGDMYRATVDARASNGNKLWAIQRSVDGTFGLTEQPVVMEFRDGAYHLVNMAYYEMPNSKDAIIIGGQGTDGTLWTAFRQPITLEDGRQIYALFYDMPVVREEDGGLVPGDWKFNPVVGIGKFGVIEGQAQRINDKFDIIALGFEADQVVQAGDSMLFIYQGMPVAIVDAEGNVAKPEQAFVKNGENWVGVVGVELVTWDGDSFKSVKLPAGVAVDQVSVSDTGVFIEANSKVQELRNGIWQEIAWPAEIQSLLKGEGDVNLDRQVIKMVEQQGSMKIVDGVPVIQLKLGENKVIIGKFEKGNWVISDFSYHYSPEQIKALFEQFSYVPSDWVFGEWEGKTYADLNGTEKVIGLRLEGHEYHFLVAYNSGGKWVDIVGNRLNYREYRPSEAGKDDYGDRPYDSVVSQSGTELEVNWMRILRSIWLLSGLGEGSDFQISLYSDSEEAIRTILEAKTLNQGDVTEVLAAWERGQLDAIKPEGQLSQIEITLFYLAKWWNFQDK